MTIKECMGKPKDCWCWVKTSADHMIDYSVKRVKDFVIEGDYDLALLISAVASIGYAITLASDPEYLSSSPRLVLLLDLFRQPVWLTLFTVEGIAQLFIFLLSGNPMFYQEDVQLAQRWVLWSRRIEIFSCLLWGTLTYLLSSKGSSFGGWSCGITAVCCFWAVCVLSTKANIRVGKEGLKQNHDMGVEIRLENLQKKIEARGQQVYLKEK